MIAPGLESLAVPLAELVLLPGNPRRGDVDAIARSLAEFGQRKPVTARRYDRVVTAGNHTVLAARQLGWHELAALWTDDDETRSLAWSLADNRVAELGGYDDVDLAAMMASVYDTDAALLAATGWTDIDLKALLARISPDTGRTDPDDVPDAPVEVVSALGDVWVLGPHRVMCGDSRKPTDLDQLLEGTRVDCLLMDPPYGINLDTDYTKLPRGSDIFRTADAARKQYRPVLGDDGPFDASPLRAYFAAVSEQFWFGADYYRHSLSKDDMDGSWLVWDKRTEQTDNVFGSSFELVWSATRHKRRVLRHYWCGVTGDPETRNKMHPTQKPTALLCDILAGWTTPGAVVVDGYGGSGSTLIACHRTERLARVTEIDPLYVDVICRRFQEHTGIVPTRLGVAHDFLK